MDVDGEGALEYLEGMDEREIRVAWLAVQLLRELAPPEPQTVQVTEGLSLPPEWVQAIVRAAVDLVGHWDEPNAEKTDDWIVRETDLVRQLVSAVHQGPPGLMASSRAMHELGLLLDEYDPNDPAGAEANPVERVSRLLEFYGEGR